MIDLLKPERVGARTNSFGARTTGSAANKNLFRYSAKYTDPESGLLYYGYRYYQPNTGRWVNRDPVSEYGGENVYSCMKNSPTDRHDAHGLSSESDIGVRLDYTCNCGWVDWGHAKPGNANSLWLQIRNGRPTGAMESKNRIGYRVWHTMGQGIWGVSVPFAGGPYFVFSRLNDAQKKSVALAIFMDVSVRFEQVQGQGIQGLLGSSSFSEEDLPSNILGFYRAVDGYSEPDIRRLCGTVSVEESKCVWKRENGLGKNYTFTPQYKKCDECTTLPKWPAEFSTITPAKQGGAWDSWREGIDW